MYVEIAEIDIDGWRSTIHSFDDVLSFEHERESADNDWTARIYLTLENGTETIVGRGYGLEVVCVEDESYASSERRGAVPHGQERV